MSHYQEGTWHVPIIRAAVEALGGVYVEIGVRYGTCFNEVALIAAEAHAVDIVRDERVVGHRFWHMTSNEFFEKYDGPAPTVVFVDADHDYQQALKDFVNARHILAKNGVIFLHDTWPVEAGNERDTGTVWVLARFIEQDETLNAFTFRRYPGLTMVQLAELERFS